MNTSSFLPRYCKIVGLLLITLAFLVPVAMGLLHLLPEMRAWKQDLSQIGILSGLFLVAFTRQPVEDEFVASCRLKAMSSAFIISIVYYLVQSLIPLLRMENFAWSGFRVFSFQLFTYLVYFHLAIRGGVFKHD